jgi:hypothetical protein
MRNNGFGGLTFNTVSHPRHRKHSLPTTLRQQRRRQRLLPERGRAEGESASGQGERYAFSSALGHHD